jgi:hypothetical protein
VRAAELGPFTGKAQSYRWDGRDGAEPLADGEYRATLTVRPDPAVALADPADDFAREATVRLDSSLAWVPGGAGPSGTGLAFMPEPFADPPGLFRMSLGAALDPTGAVGTSGPEFLMTLGYAAPAFSLSGAAALASGTTDGWNLAAALAWPLTERGSGIAFAASFRAGGGRGDGASREWSGDDATGAAGGFRAGLGAAFGRKGTWIGAQPELGLWLSDGGFGWTLALRAGASAGGAAWRLGVSAEQAFDAAFGGAGLEARMPRAAAEAHLMPGTAPLFLSLAFEADLGANLAPESPRIAALLGVAF